MNVARIDFQQLEPPIFQIAGSTSGMKQAPANFIMGILKIRLRFKKSFRALDSIPRLLSSLRPRMEFMGISSAQSWKILTC